MIENAIFHVGVLGVKLFDVGVCVGGGGGEDENDAGEKLHDGNVCCGM